MNFTVDRIVKTMTATKEDVYKVFLSSPEGHRLTLAFVTESEAYSFAPGLSVKIEITNPQKTLSMEASR